MSKRINLEFKMIYIITSCIQKGVPRCRFRKIYKYGQNQILWNAHQRFNKYVLTSVSLQVAVNTPIIFMLISL